MSKSELFEKGLQVRKDVLGEDYVNKSIAGADEFTRTMAEWSTEFCWGALWTRPGLDIKTRALICVISDTCMGREPELALHLRMALRQGWTEEELTEALLHLSGYIGVPIIRECLQVASKVFKEPR